jgi:hypothetical protein
VCKCLITVYGNNLRIERSGVKVWNSLCARHAGKRMYGGVYPSLRRACACAGGDCVLWQQLVAGRHGCDKQVTRR